MGQNGGKVSVFYIYYCTVLLALLCTHPTPAKVVLSQYIYIVVDINIVGTIHSHFIFFVSNILCKQIECKYAYFRTSSTKTIVYFLLYRLAKQIIFVRPNLTNTTYKKNFLPINTLIKAYTVMF